MDNSPMMRRFAAAELTLVFTLVMLQIWVFPVWMGFAVVGPTIIFFMWFSTAFRPSGNDMTALEYFGIQPQDFSQFGRMLLVGTISIALMVALAYLICPNFHERPDYWKKVLTQFKGYFVWAFLQQLLLQGYLTNRLEVVFEKKWRVAVATGILFAIAHLPNSVLTPATAIFGAIGAYFFLKSRNIYLATLFHALLGTAVKYILASPLLDNAMRVGPGYWR